MKKILIILVPLLLLICLTSQSNGLVFNYNNNDTTIYVYLPNETREYINPKGYQYDWYKKELIIFSLNNGEMNKEKYYNAIIKIEYK